MTKIVVIGSGAAGMTAASEARRTDPNADIRVFTEDGHIAYSPCAIPWVIEGKMDWKDIVMHDPSYYSGKRGIQVMTRTKVTAVDWSKKKVTANGESYDYDSLVVATGGTVFIPPINGKDLPGTFIVRTIDDAVAIRDALPKSKKIAVIGAGVIGLEIAVAMRNAGKDVMVVEMFDQPIPRICDRDMALRVQKHLEGLNIRFLFGTPIESVNGSDRVKGITAGGKEYDCDVVIFATGVRANLDIPRMLELDIGALNGVVVAPSMNPYRKGRIVNDVFVAGDVIQCQSSATDGPTMSQLGSSAVKQGIIAGKNAAGGKASLGPTTSPWISMVGNIQIGGAGLSEGLASWYGMKTMNSTAEGWSNARYYPGGKEMTVKLIADTATRRIVGAQLMSEGDINGHVNWLSSVISQKTTVDSFLADGENAYCPPTSMVRDVVFDAAEELRQILNSE